MIRNREKLKLAMWLLLIVRNGAFAELKCYRGVQVDDKDGYDEKTVPESVACPPFETCLRVEADEAEVGGNKIKNVVGLSCVESCVDSYEMNNEMDKDRKSTNLLTEMTGDKFSNLIGLKVRCCDTDDDCNFPEKPKPETSSGSKLVASLTLLVVSVAAFF